VSRYFGQLLFGQLYGYCFIAFSFGSSAGRFLGGYAYELATPITRNWSYRRILVMA
jgi:hypothetical protein